MSEKKWETSDLIYACIATALFVGLLAYVIVTPAKTDPRCTASYVEENGESDCSEYQDRLDDEQNEYIERQM